MASKTYKIGVVGNRDAILPFRLIGFQTFPVTEVTDVVNTLRRLSREDFAIIYLTEDMVGHKLGEFVPTRTFKGHKDDAKSSKAR